MPTPAHKVTVKLAEPVVRAAFAPFTKFASTARIRAARAITAALRAAFPDITRANLAFLQTRIRLNGIVLGKLGGKR